jgi:hypothetical protein
MARKVSASNVAEMKPVSKAAAAANVTGAIGAALAEVFFQFEENRAANILGEQKSMKERLKEIAGLPGNKEHVAFRETLAAHVKEINAEADKFKLKLTDYLDSNPAAAHMYSSLSMWQRMSRACELGTGWINYEKPWAEISKAATQALNAQAATAEQARLNEQAKKIQADPKMTAARKEAEIAVINARIKAVAVKASPTARTAPGQPATTATPESNYDKAIKLLDQLDLGTLEKVAAWLQRRIESAHKRSVQATPSARAKAPTSAEHSANEREEEAVARGTPKAGKRASKRK